jgi:hypothetical protein
VGSLSRVQKQVILGSILGDGYMRKKINAHLQITHSYKQKEYVDWKYEILKNIVLTKPSSYRGNANRIGYRFFTKSLPELTKFYDIFYKGREKIVPKGIILTPIILAIWYMDDGNKSYKSCYFNTQKFSAESQENLMEALKLIGINSKLNRDKKYFRIRITTESTKILFGMMKEFIIPSMLYKISI